LAMLVLQGFCWSIVVASHLNWGMRHAPGRTDVLMALYQSLYNVGNMVGPIAGGWILAAYGPEWLPAASVVLAGAALVVVLTGRPWGLLGRMRAARAAALRTSRAATRGRGAQRPRIPGAQRSRTPGAQRPAAEARREEKRTES
ncbi:MAG: hypothetical protein LPK38_02310, partial [Actinomycetes bacterium]|nr:hypothetical protein [Actinomycetes bacterium]MDX5449853.1 hypothetical protein [Actinomycetes bacterium]